MSFATSVALPLLRFILGAIAFAVRMPCWIIGAVLKGKSPPPFKRSAAGVGAGGLTSCAVKLKDAFATSADGCKIHVVQDDGAGRVAGKRPIVFVHGFPELWISYAKQLEHFSKLGHPVYAMSLRGYGLSDKPQDLRSYHLYDCLAADVRAAVAHAAKDGGGGAGGKPLLVAHDWGAGVSWPFVGQGISRGHEVAGYVSLANPPAEAFKKNLTAWQAWASLYMVFFNAPLLPEWILCAGDAWLVALLINDCAVAKPSPDVLNMYRTNALAPGGMTAQLNYYRAVIQDEPRGSKADVLKESNKLDLPVLMIRGKGDVALLADIFKGYERFLADGRLVELDNCSHWIQKDAPDAINSNIEDFLKHIA